eukprot:6273954-Pyramimonas_sp.AAC.1
MLGARCKPFGSLLGASVTLLGCLVASRGSVGALSGCLGVLLGCLGALGLSWAVPGPLRAFLEAFGRPLKA